MAQPIIDDRDRAGTIQGFELTFEQSWKEIQKVSSTSGSHVGSPKQAFTLAILSGWIDRAEESNWLKLIEDRVLTPQTYREEVARDVLGRTQPLYVRMFESLLANLRLV